MFHDRQDLTELIGSRICHDLISPLGAISNGLELLEMSGQTDTPEMELIAESIASANSKIRFFRIAYGRAPNGSTLASPEITSTLRDYFLNTRLNTIWHPDREVQRHDVKMAFLAIQCLESSLPYGGQIDVFLEGTEWVLRASGEKLKADMDIWTLLEGQAPADNLDASHVQFGMLAMLTQWRKPAISVTISEQSILLRLRDVTQPAPQFRTAQKLRLNFGECLSMLCSRVARFSGQYPVSTQKGQSCNTPPP